MIKPSKSRAERKAIRAKISHEIWEEINEYSNVTNGDYKQIWELFCKNMDKEKFKSDIIYRQECMVMKNNFFNIIRKILTEYKS